MKKRQNAGLNRLTEDVQTIIDTIQEEYGGCPVIIRCVSILRLVKTMCSNRRVSESRAE